MNPSSENDTIAVVIPVYNGAGFLRATLDSVLGQSVQPTEIIVVDDGSRDESAQITASYGEKVRTIHQENRGQASARNTGARAARSTWIALLDQDDLCLPERLRKTLDAARAAPSARWIYSDYLRCRPTDPAGTYVTVPGPESLAKVFRYQCPIMPSFSTIRRDTLLEIGGFDERPEMIGVDDHDLLLRFMRRHGATTFHRVPEALVRYQLHDSNFSSNIQKHYAGRTALLSTQLDDLSGVRRFYWKRLLRAQLYYDMAILMREQGIADHLRPALLSLALWPFPHRAICSARYKASLHMLLAHSGLWQKSKCDRLL
jgi:glycosyltransferase involved in cell wall biosynthesis